MDPEFTQKLDGFINSGLLGSIPKLIAAFSAKIGKNYILYQPGVCKDIEFGNEEEEMAPLQVYKMRMRTKDKIPIFGRIYSPHDATPDTPIVFYFTANAESVAAISGYIRNYCRKRKCHFAVVNFRGYGNSRGVPYQAGFRIDIETTLKEFVNSALKVLTGKFQTNVSSFQRLYFHGRSLGCGTALEAAVKLLSDSQMMESLEKCQVVFSGIILDSGFSSLANIGTEWVPCLENCKRDVFHGENWDNLRQIEALSRMSAFKSTIKFLVVNSEEDSICGHQHSQVMAEKIKSLGMKCEHKTFLAGGHNDYFDVAANEQEYDQLLLEFFSN